MAKPKKYNAKELAERIKEYFDSISVIEPVFAREIIYKKAENGDMIPELDFFGHPKTKLVPVIGQNKEQIQRLRWLVQPKIVDLCDFLKISPTTWEKYCKESGKVESTTYARGRVESYLQEKLMEKDSSRGAKFALEYNFGWKERREISVDEDTRGLIGEKMTMEQKKKLLEEIGEQFGRREKEHEG